MICVTTNLIEQPFRIDGIAHNLGMSILGVHHHFKAVITMNPLQLQIWYSSPVASGSKPPNHR